MRRTTGLHGCLAVGFSLALAASISCGGGRRDTITVTGSDTMVSLAGKWAGEYFKTHPDVQIEVSGGGTGAGIAGLMSDTVQIANASHELIEDDKKKIQVRTGKEPKEFKVALDAIAIYVNKDNPIESITFEQLAEIFGDGGKYGKWSDVDPKLPDEKIVVLGRESNSGTYAYFHEQVVGKERKFKSDVGALSGSRDLVNLVTQTKTAIGYSGMGYITPDVKVVPLAKKAGDTPYPPTVENAVEGKYPLARYLYVYTVGEPTGAVKEYIDWMLGPEGQKVVADAQFVPVPK